MKTIEADELLLVNGAGWFTDLIPSKILGDIRTDMGWFDCMNKIEGQYQGSWSKKTLSAAERKDMQGAQMAFCGSSPNAGGIAPLDPLAAGSAPVKR